MRWLGNERGRLAACGHCDGVLRALAVRNVAAAKVAIPDLLGRLRSREAAGMLAVIGALSGLSSLPLPLIDLALVGLAAVCTAATAINLIDHLAHGRAGFPSPVGVEGIGWMPFVQRGALAAVVLATPLGLWLGANRGAENIRELATARPLSAFLLVLVSALWFSAALIAMLASDRALPAFWPPALLQAARRSSRLFVSLALLVAAGGLVVVGVHMVLARWLGSPPFLSQAARGVALGALVLALAALAGGLVHRHADRVLDHYP